MTTVTRPKPEGDPEKPCLLQAAMNYRESAYTSACRVTELETAIKNALYLLERGTPGDLFHAHKLLRNALSPVVRG